MKFSIIIPTYHDWERLQTCLISLERQTLPASEFEIIVVNNAPNDPPPTDFIFPANTTLLNEARPGSYAARNRAIKEAKGEIFAFTDSDCQPKENWLETAKDFFQKNPTVHRIGGKISLLFKSKNPTYSEIYEKAFAFRQQDFVSKQGMAATANMFAKRYVFEQVGLFRDDFLSGGDAEWGIRANSKGFKIQYLESCIVKHPTRNIKEIISKAKRVAGGHFLLLHKKSTLLVIAKIALGFLPPIKSMYKIANDLEVPLKEKLIALGIRYYLRIISTIEIFKIYFLKKTMKRN